MARVYLSLGSNDQPLMHLQATLQMLQGYFSDLIISSIFSSPARDNDAPDFLNQVLGGDTRLTYTELKAVCKQTEQDQGRGVTPHCSIDIDILLYDDVIDAEKKLPHPDILRYSYVLQPLAEVAGERLHPQTQRCFAAEVLQLQSQQYPDLPSPSAGAAVHSTRLLQCIQQRIHQAEGSVSFADYMQMALYEPRLGYYVAGSEKFAEQGDFITAPDISPLFTQCVARQCEQVLQSLPTASILECGAGQGSLAAGILNYLATVDCLPEKYFILEPSADLQQRQQNYLQQHCPTLLARCEWLAQLPTHFVGVIVANEVLDAMPVHQFCWQAGQFQEYYVTGALQYQLRPIINSRLAEALATIDTSMWTGPYHSEINLAIGPWLQDISQALQQGIILLLDYGFPRHEYYVAQRSMGTLMCHYRHRSHDNVFWYPGLQDITAHVDFTAVAEAATAADLEVLGFTNQANFLLNCGLLEQVTLLASDEPQQRLQLNQQVSKLIDPHEMGEIFKVIALGRQFGEVLIGFSQQDKTHTL